MKVENLSVMSSSLWPHGLYSTWNSLGQNTECVAFPSSRESSQPRIQTQISHTADRFFTSWATRKALIVPHNFEVMPHLPFKGDSLCSLAIAAISSVGWCMTEVSSQKAAYILKLEVEPSCPIHAAFLKLV